MAYNARYEASEAPAMTSVVLSVQKAEGKASPFLDDVSRDYNGQPVETPRHHLSEPALSRWNTGPQGGEFTTQAPKAVGSYYRSGHGGGRR